MNRTQFKKDLERIINCNSIENGSDTPDWMLADYLMGCLEIYENTIKEREKWYGRPPKIYTDIPVPSHPVLTNVVGLL